MRLHHLQIRAFGPFGGTESIDFDALGAHGLFLMHGPTGSGKTTVLDAVCFAIYSSVPGARRSQVERLVSDHAQPGISPQVTLEFTVAGRRLRITRSPKHLVAKKRGSGHTPRQAKVLLEERRAGAWTALSTRADETADLLDELIGLGLDQFAQVVLLPQGEFAAFLRAKADDRAALLQKLFDISRFADLEAWLVERRRTVRTSVADSDAAVHTAIVRAEESLVELAPQIEQWRALAVDTLPAQIADAAASTSALLSEAMAATERTAAAAEAAARAHDRAEQLLALQRKGAAAADTWSRWEAAADDRDRAEQVLEAHRRAGRVLPSLRTVERARSRATQSRHHAAETHAALGATGLGEPAAVRGELTAGRAPLAEAVEADRAVRRAEAELPRLATVLETARSALVTVDAARSELLRRTEIVEVTIGTAREIASGSDDLARREALLADWEQTRRAVRDAERSAAQAAAEVASTAQTYAAAEQAVIDLRTRRLAGFAGELALDLEPGTPCPVCGAVDHPAPASSAAIVGADEVAAAEASAAQARLAHDRADRGATTARATATTLTDRVAAIAAQWNGLTGDVLDSDAATRVRAEIVTRREAVDRARRTVDAGEHELQELARRVRSLDEQHRQAEQTATRAEADRDALQTGLTAAIDRREAALAAHSDVCACGSYDGDIAQRRAHHDRLEQLVERWIAADRDAVTSNDALTEASDELNRQLEDEGFDDAAAVHGALLDRASETELTDRLRREHDAAQRARGVLDQPDVEAALAAAPADPQTALQLRRDAQAADRQAQAQYDTASRAVKSLERLAGDVERLLSASRADRQLLPALDRLADVVTGAGDNQLRMRLSAYVLAARLEQVTTLANHQLDVMSSGRYRLEHTDAKAKGGARSGLGLLVRDSWTGTARDTATLSGGETFMVSLALALALGEAVLHDAGGRPLETLLVDEGFGSLDDESLELVMQVLDELRSGGRTVGIVSHVGELRTRVPAQIRVHKAEHGSRVEVHVGDASSAA